MEIQLDENAVAKQIVDTAFHVHVDLGPGLLESIYETVLARRLEGLGLRVERQKAIPICVDGIRIDAGLKADLLINDLVIVELKSVDHMNPVFAKQLKSYLKLSGKRLGLLVNFGMVLFKHGVCRVALGLD